MLPHPVAVTTPIFQSIGLLAGRSPFIYLLQHYVASLCCIDPTTHIVSLAHLATTRLVDTN